MRFRFAENPFTMKEQQALDKFKCAPEKNYLFLKRSEQVPRYFSIVK